MRFERCRSAAAFATHVTDCASVATSRRTPPDRRRVHRLANRHPRGRRAAMGTLARRIAAAGDDPRSRQERWDGEPEWKEVAPASPAGAIDRHDERSVACWCGWRPGVSTPQPRERRRAAPARRRALDRRSGSPGDYSAEAGLRIACGRDGLYVLCSHRSATSCGDRRSDFGSYEASWRACGSVEIFAP
jgi:hypothetical protein